MKRFSLAAGVCLIAGLTLGVSVVAQERGGGGRGTAATARMQTDGPLSDNIIANVPFSAEAVTTVTQTLADGTKVEQRTTTKWYRDSLGRVRREQTVLGLDRLNPSAQAQTTITFDSVPGDRSPYTLNPATKAARRGALAVMWSGGVPSSVTYFSNSGRITDLLPAYERKISPAYGHTIRSGLATAPIPADLKATEEQLGSRQIEGVKATGRRSTTTIPAGRIGNDRAIQVVEEQWDSPELNMVVLSRFSDPRTGVVEYRLTNINRSEPRADLFQVPADYTVIDNGWRLRTGGAGGQGGRGN